MSEEKILQLIKNKHNIEAVYSEVISAKFVNVRGDKHCKCCGRTLKSGSRALTASHLMDKKLNVDGRFAILSGYNNNSLRFVKVRHWLCPECATQRALEKLHNNRICELELQGLSYQEQLETLEQEYEKGNIGNKEYQDIEQSIIHAKSLEDAVGIGQF